MKTQRGPVWYQSPAGPQTPRVKVPAKGERSAFRARITRTQNNVHQAAFVWVIINFLSPEAHPPSAYTGTPVQAGQLQTGCNAGIESARTEGAQVVFPGGRSQLKVPRAGPEGPGQRTHPSSGVGLPPDEGRGPAQGVGTSWGHRGDSTAGEVQPTRL